MNRFFILSFFFFAIFSFIPSDTLICSQPTPSGTVPDFKEEQNCYPRVRQARQEKETGIVNLFEEKGAEYPPSGVLIVVYKIDRVLELWSKSVESDSYVHVKDYKICALSGVPGPKRMGGDFQIPEGLYKIILFNPVSSFHLSLKINYPNRSDRILGYKPSLGGLIFIHGDCVTIGCIPITDDGIKELYIIAVDAKSRSGNASQVYIFPTRMSSKRMNELKKNAVDNVETIIFWENLKTAYDRFIKTKKPLKYYVNSKGRYIIE